MKAGTPEFSIVIPTYNRASHLARAINSVLVQTEKNFELIVVDDGSTDDTEVVVKRIIDVSAPGKIRYFRKANGERAAARNYGLDRAAGEYISYFDSDDALYPHHLATARDFLSSKPGAEFFHLRYDILAPDGSVKGTGPAYDEPPNRHLISGNFLSCNGVFIRRDVALNNRFNEDRELSAAEDWELWLRLAAQYTLHYVNDITSSVIDHDERSVVAVNREKLIRRMELLQFYAGRSPLVTGFYRNEMSSLRSSCLSYIALHLALTRQYRKDAVMYLFRSIAARPAFVFSKRFVATIRRII